MRKSVNCKARISPFAAALGLSLSLIFIPAGQASAAQGYTNYVTDSIDIPVRRGPGYKFKISQMLKSGTPVKILEVNKEGWALVEYNKKGDHQGWMPTSVLQNQPIAKTQLKDQIAKTNQLEEKLGDLNTELNTLKERFTSTKTELETTKKEKFELAKELNRLTTLSSNAVELDQQNQEMKLRLSELENHNTIMREQLDQANDTVKRQWFLTGGGVLLLGLLLGRFFRVPTKRKRWGEI
ncbi:MULTISPECIES: TIGR04211 family SH3 domain-containing protein [Thiomicrorhabdus]|uniref:TIGR04211 family SH3 domain-containing protein n=1 Tax=Thiomicrorhabdus heinhorstiae TaxID=2748010 RepID=A0ABS0BTM7_9GAMM|nr:MULTISPECIES: TIGR04211 family SH3 domain-containing protein [Thiomicrorhabdus]MBF6057198.1 TIGR04211 family SH3 domain-containing protein [Thiomicrorhabdus heinhorstiae]